MAETTKTVSKEDAPQLNRAERRAAFFNENHTKPKHIEMSWNGITFEWRAPTILQVQKANEVEGRHFMVTMLIDHSYVEPGSDEKLFEDSDYDQLVSMPLTGEFSACVSKISAALNMKVEEKAKN